MAQIIGSGASATVFKVVFKNSCRVIKRVSKTNFRYIAAEIRAFETMQQEQVHENIIEWYDIVEDADNYHIHLEYVDGLDLYHMLLRDNTSLSEKRCALIFKQMCEGVRFMHSCGVLHRDLKLENCLITSSDKIKWIDFGLSYVYIDEEEVLERRAGTRSYFAPEMYRGKYSGFASDVWSLGVCLFAMLLRFFPFEVANSSDWRFQKATVHDSVLSTVYTFYPKESYPDVSMDAKIVLDQMLRINPSKRVSMEKLLEMSWLSRKFISDMSTTPAINNTAKSAKNASATISQCITYLQKKYKDIK